MSTLQRIPTPYSYSAAVAAGDYVFLSLHRGFGDSFARQFEDAFCLFMIEGIAYQKR